MILIFSNDKFFAKIVYSPKYLIFSNILLDSKHSNLYMRISKNLTTEIYSKKQFTHSKLLKRNKNIFKFLLKNKIIPKIWYQWSKH